MKNIIKPYFFQLIVFSVIILLSQKSSANTHDAVTAIAENASTTWVGTHHGLYKINKSTNRIEHYTKENSLLPSNYVNAIAIEKDGNVWIGTANGILRYDQYAFYVLNSTNSSLPDDHITAIVCTKEQDIIIGTFYEGIVMKVHNGKFIHYSTENAPLINNCILSITIDQNDNIWLGYLGAGVTQLNNQNHWTIFNEENNFNAKNICFVTVQNGDISFYGYNGEVILLKDGKINTQNMKRFNGRQLVVHYTNTNERYWVYYNNIDGVISIGNNNQTNQLLNQKIKKSFLPSNEGFSFPIEHNIVMN